ncbi:Translation initiation factor 2 subunit beta [Metallosphaera sp. J1]|uniref:translation initiation factor IF-2 subunit beta n=1 Tax=Metallosphaera TaxID=41980 RepID=UPI001EDE2E5B|nr:translation initiation factor IF-2 subunit beta [Metallosphaera javensis (ex Hofmann et al. 2022)]MCG3108423.1 Translation initiation factor 2 subunit beta [Metallosphaera javensis (ex Hofmann et al. 2022)]BCS92816.1 MAG: translation initiation factor 2 subunit beta [Metallosphaera javensis (ex Sakai et al. 2022)]
MSERDKLYNVLLDRLYTKLPKKDLAAETQTLPTLTIINVGNTTIIRNFSEYCDRIRREDKICMRYLLKELAAAGSISENGQLMIQGKFSNAIVNTFMDRFLKTYVQCSTCKSLDTVLVKEKKIWYIQCLACGAKNPVKPL